MPYRKTEKSGRILRQIDAQLIKGLTVTIDKKKYDIDFSLAIRNRTGKYIIGAQIIKDHPDLINKVYYWRTALSNSPNKYIARILDISSNIEIRIRRATGGRYPPVAVRRIRTLHIDPYTVTMSTVSAQDIVLIHDVGPVSNPDLFDVGVETLYDSAFRRAKQADARLVFVSKSSKDEFCRLYGATSDMRVIYPPIRTGEVRHDERPVAGIDRPFLLTVGSVGRRKNQQLCIEAFARSGLPELGYAYVICGAREPGAEKVEASALSTSGVYMLPFVSEGELAWLYAKAQGFVLMSMLEGFGMPVAEAISSGLVPLVTANSVLEEVAGRQALTADNDDPEQIADGMRNLVMMTPDEKSQRTAELKSHIVKFSQEQFSEQWREVLS